MLSWLHVVLVTCCVYSLEESGQTALGPAVLVSLVIASQKPGSKVSLKLSFLRKYSVSDYMYMYCLQCNFWYTL